MISRLILTLKTYFSISGMSIKNIETFIAIRAECYNAILFEISFYYFYGKVLSIDIDTCPLYAMNINSWCNFQPPKLLLWQKRSHKMIVIYLQPYCNISFISSCQWCIGYLKKALFRRHSYKMLPISLLIMIVILFQVAFSQMHSHLIASQHEIRHNDANNIEWMIYTLVNVRNTLFHPFLKTQILRHFLWAHPKVKRPLYVGPWTLLR